MDGLSRARQLLMKLILNLPSTVVSSALHYIQAHVCVLRQNEMERCGTLLSFIESTFINRTTGNSTVSELFIKMLN